MKLKIKSLKKKWNVDEDEILLHASFQILENYLKKENYKFLCKETHKTFLNELHQLKKFWKFYKKDAYYFSKEEENEMLIRLIKIRNNLWV